MRLARFLAAGSFLALAWAAGADPPRPLRAPDEIGVRELALSAYLGVAPGNGGIFTNPAGLAARRRYAIDGQYLVGRAGSENETQVLGGSVVDSQLSSTAMGFAYDRILSGAFPGSTYHLALALPMAQGVYLGATGKYLVLDGPAGEQVQAVTADAGLFWQLSSIVSLGAAGYNLVPIGHRSQFPLGFGAGIAVGHDQGIQVAADWRADLQGPGGKLRNAFAGGVEYLAGGTVALRAGYLKDDRLDGQFWSAGIGFVSSGVMAVDFSYRQAFAASDHRILAAALTVFLPVPTE